MESGEHKITFTAMQNTDEIIASLWNQGKAAITAENEEIFVAELTRPQGFFDIILSYGEEQVGFVTIKHERDTIYSIVNETKLNPHPTFLNTPGHGIEVKEKYRKKGIGAALLSLGIGIAQQDFRTRKLGGLFEVIASDITHLGLGCYQHFGFRIRQGMSVSAGHFLNPDKVLPIKITRKKAGRLVRLKKRLGFA